MIAVDGGAAAEQPDEYSYIMADFLKVTMLRASIFCEDRSWNRSNIRMAVAVSPKDVEVQHPVTVSFLTRYSWIRAHLLCHRLLESNAHRRSVLRSEAWFLAGTHLLLSIASKMVFKATIKKVSNSLRTWIS
jgi:hypothetical protein